MTASIHRLAIAVGAMLVMAVVSGCGGESQTPEATDGSASGAPSAAVQPQAGKKAFVLRGKVESVDATARTMSVNHENVEGWMAAMTMIYKADKPEIVDKLKAGDQITATVYEGDFATLYDIQIVTAGK